MGFYQFNIVFGILVAFFSNYVWSGMSENAWRFMLGIEALPAIIYTLLVLRIPQSPRWLFLQGRLLKPRPILAKAYASNEIDEILTDLGNEVSRGKAKKPFGKRNIVLPYFWLFSLLFQSILRHQCFLYYAPQF